MITEYVSDMAKTVETRLRKYDIMEEVGKERNRHENISCRGI